MESFDLTKLCTDREHLSKVMRAFVELGSKYVEMSSHGDSLRIFGHADKRKLLDSVTLNSISVVCEYLGDTDRGYVKPEEVIRVLATRKESRFPIPSYAQPLGWGDEFAERSFRGAEGVTFDPQQLKEALGYLLRLDLTQSMRDYFGIIFNNNEMLTTNNQLMLVQSNMPAVTTTPRLLGYDLAVALYSVLRTSFISETQLSIARKSLIFGARVELDDGVEMFFWSKPRYNVMDSFKDPRMQVSPSSVGFVVQADILDSVLSHTIAGVTAEEKPVISFSTAPQGLLCTSWGAGTTNRIMYQGTIPMSRSMGTEDVVICTRADCLLQAVKGMGSGVQFIVPQHPLLGLEIHAIESFYVNCNPNQFALVAPFILNHDSVVHLERLKRKANNAMEPL